MVFSGNFFVSRKCPQPNVQKYAPAQPPPRALYLLDRKAVLLGSNLTEGEILIISTQYESIILYYFWFQYLYGFSQVKVSVDEFFVAGEKSYDSLSYTWDAVAEFPEKTQEELYSITKMVISNYWVSAQDVIQNDDKENGMLVVKGVASVDVSQSGYFYTYDYAYTVTFMQKEGRCRIKISRLYCERSVYELFGMSRECPRVELWDIDAKTMRVGLVK